jgi:PKD repeat protein
MSMRPRTAILVLLILLLSSRMAPTGQAQSGTWSLQILEADERHVLLELTLPAFESQTVTHDGVKYQRLRVAQWGYWGRPGQPRLPMYSIPLGTPGPEVPQISVIEAERQVVEGVMPYPVPVPALEGTEGAPRVIETFAFDADAYSTDTFYPGTLTEPASIGFLRDQPMFQLRLYPFQYNPRHRELHVYRRLRVQVSFPQGRAPAAEAGHAQPAPVFERILKRTLLNYDALPHPKPAPVRRASGPLVRPDSGPQVKLRVERSGLHRVAYGDLLAVAPDLLEGDPRDLALSNQGAAIPILFDGEGDGAFGPGDSFVFYGRAIHSDYTRDNVYWLSDSGTPGLHMAQRDGTPGAGSTPDAFSDHRHYEQDNTYWRALPNGEGEDHWFWDKLSVSGSSPASANYAFDLCHIAPNGPDGELHLALHGATSGDHLTQLMLNGVALLSPAERAWSGRIEKLYVVPVPQDLFLEGTNHVRVESILPAGQSSSDVYVNWFEVAYRDTYVVEDDRLLFSAPSAGTYTFELTGFSANAIELFDITDPAAPVHIVNPLIEPDGDSYRLRFSDDATAERRYLAQRTDPLPTPSLQVDESSTWKSPAHGATHLIITHPSFYDAVRPLAAYRSGQGETAVVVQTEDVYDEFNDGIYDPQAIRRFIEYAYRNWSPKPAYVLLVGDASRDPKNNLGSSLPDLLPAYYVDTPLFGQAANDSWYAKVHGDDDYPDVIIGRVPARRASDVTTVVDKVQVYEQSPPPGEWMRRAVLVADDGNPAFTQDMDTIARMLPATISPIQMYDYDPSTSVRDEASAGASLFAYSGHGNTAGSAWGTWPGGHRIFNQSQMQNMWNGDKLPFMSVANCLNGWFDRHDRSRVMAEEFLLLNDKGGIASWAPASYGFPTTNGLILEELYRALLMEEDRTLGSAATTARIQAHLRRPDLPLSLFEVFTYFGDPAVRLNLPATLELGGEAIPDPAVVGEPLTYTLAYTVSGADQARGLTLVNHLPREVIHQCASPAPSSTYGQMLTWNLGDATAGRYTVTITAQAKSTGLAHGQILWNQAHLYDAAGGDQVLRIETTVHDSPIAGLSASDDSPTGLGDVTTLSATTTSGTSVVYTWDLGDESPVRTGAAVQHTYPTVGTYAAQVTAANGVNSESQTTAVTVFCIPPAASFISSSPDKPGQTTTLQSTSTGTNPTCRWDFGDGYPPVSTDSSSITHTYSAVGRYALTLTVSNSAGSSAAFGIVEIVENTLPPVARFTSTTPDEIGQTTVFINTSQDGADEDGHIRYAWDFGDGSFSTVKHPTHTYAVVGIYTVSLTISNSLSSDALSDTVLITDARIGGLTSENDSPTTLGHATALSATTASGTNIAYHWALGDGNSRTRQYLTHTYGAVGSYFVVLTATNSSGSQVVTDTVVVVDEPIEGLSISHSGPTVLGRATTFTALNTAGTNLTYRWDLGDGTTSTLQSLAHTYGAVGCYPVTLTATNSWGSLVRFDTVSIGDVPISGLSVSHDGPTMLGAPTRFTATVAAGTSVAYYWDLGDGHTGAGAHLAHAYAAPGTYDLTVTAINQANESVRSASVTVLDPELSLFLPLVFRND